MFDKKKVAFKSTLVFGSGFKPAIEDCFCKLSKLVFAGKVNPDGTIDPSKADAFKKSELWSYIYYMYSYNSSDVPEFQIMKNPDTGKADAHLFYMAIVRDPTTSIVPISNTSLIAFINDVIRSNTDLLVNPVFDYLQLLTQRKDIYSLNGLDIVTGTKANVVSGNAAKNANIKITIKPKTI